MSGKKIEVMVDDQGREFWMEPSTFQAHPLPSGNIYSLTEGETKELNFDLKHNESMNTIDIKCIEKGTDQEGPTYNIPASEFMRVLYDAYIKQDSFSRRSEVLEFKKKASDLFVKSQMLSGNALYNKAGIEEYGKGIGYIRYDNDVVAVFDTFTLEKNAGHIDIITRNVYTDIRLTEEKDPSIEIILENGAMYKATNVINIEPGETGILKEYVFTISGFVFGNGHEDKFVQLIEPVAENDPNWQDQRKNLLASGSDDSSIDDRFDDIFDF